MGKEHVLWLVCFPEATTISTHFAKPHAHHSTPFAMSSDAGDEGLDLFQEPADFYKPEKEATFATHQLLSGKEITVRLVGHNPLWVSDVLTSQGLSHLSFLMLSRHCVLPHSTKILHVGPTRIMLDLLCLKKHQLPGFWQCRH
jgi:hypothetical protein